MAQPSSQGTDGRGPAAPPSDQELARQGRDGSGAATAELYLRCAPAIDRQVLRWAGRRLSPEDINDARQEAAIAFLWAVAKYDPPEGDEHPACFRTFLNSVVSNTLLDWDRSRRRVERPFDRSADGPAVLDRQALQARRAPPGPWRLAGATDPAILALCKEACAHLDEVLFAQGAEQTFLWYRRAVGRSLAQAAGELDMSYSRAKRAFHQLVVRMRNEVE